MPGQLLAKTVGDSYIAPMKQTANEELATCLNCGAPLGGRFCSACGQDSRAGRLSFRDILSNVADEVFKLDLPIARTVIDLTWRPGRVASEYVAGRRQSFTNPLKYCLLVTAITLLWMQIWPIQIEPGDMPVDSEAAALKQASLEAVAVVQAWAVRLGAAITLLLLPILAAFSRLFFLRAGRNFAEHCALGLYVHGHWYLLTIPLLPFAANGQVWALVSSQLIVIIMFPLAACGFFPGRYWTIIPRALLAMLLYLVAYMLLFQAAVIVYLMIHPPG
jgi:hypothetical protein